MHTSTHLQVLAGFAAFALVSACGPQGAAWGEVDGAQDTSELALTLSPADTGLVLALVNDPATNVARLDEQVGLDHRAAVNILARRDGADGRAGTADDVPFTTLAQLDAVPYVGDVAFSKLLAYAQAHPAQPQGETVEGVVFAGWEAAAVIWGVNHAPASRLRDMLDARAADGLVAARPFTTVAQMGPVPYVGASALDRLRREAKTWQAAMQHQPPVSLGGTFDGITFDDALATQALAIANGATREQLLAHGVASAPASALIAARPFSTLAAVAAVGGVGTVTMKALADYAASGTFGAQPLDVAALRAQLQALTQDLWFPSETDARLLFVAAPGLGTAPISERAIRELLSTQHDALLPQVMWVDPAMVPLSTRTHVEQRNAVDFLNALITNADPNDPVSQQNAARFATLRDFLTANLTDLVVFRFGTINISTFLLGRSADGQLVGLLTGQVET